MIKRLRLAGVAALMMFSNGALVLGLSGCSRGENSLQGSPNGGGNTDQGSQLPDEKIDPDKIVEVIRPLLLQQPTQVEEKFLNIQQIEFGEQHLQAAFTFTFVPSKSGSLFYSNIQSRLFLEGCTKDLNRVVTFNVVWQEDLGTSRKRLKQFEPDITEYTFEAGKKYMLTYALVKLPEEVADCKGATVKFAVFQKTYGKDPK